MTAGRPRVAAAPRGHRSVSSTPAPTAVGATQSIPISIRSTEMSHVMHEDLARAHLSQRLANADRARLAAHVARVAKARRESQRAVRAAERAQLRLRLLVS